MPNWCSTHIIFSGDEEALRDFYNKLNIYTSKDFISVSNGFGETWLGNIVVGFGGNYKETDCRGYIVNLEDEIDINGTVIMDTETAWAPCIDMFDDIIQKNYLDKDGLGKILFDYIAEEFGCGVYITNNFMAFSNEAYNVYAIVNDKDIYEYFGSEEEVVDCINDKYGMRFKSIEEIESYDFGDDNFVSIHKLEEV